jgi:hypothetical protein
MELVGAIEMRSDVKDEDRLTKDSFPDCEVCQVALVPKRACLV